MQKDLMLFLGTLTTLLAIINPLEALPIYLRLLEGKSKEEHVNVARRACLYAMVLMFFFLLFGNLMLMLFGVPLSMVRIVGGMILIRIGFSLFMPSPNDGLAGGSNTSGGDVYDFAFIPLAMPIMFGPGAMATITGMSSMIERSRSFTAFLSISIAIVLTVVITYYCLVYARFLLKRLGARTIDAATRIVGFFVSAMGMALIFHGLEDVLALYGIFPKK